MVVYIFVSMLIGLVGLIALINLALVLVMRALP